MTTHTEVTIDANDKGVKALVSNIRAAVKSGALYSAYVAEHGVTRETVAAHAATLAFLAYPTRNGAAPVQKKDGVRTPYGNAVQAAGAGLRRALPTVESEDTTDYLKAVVKAALAASEHAIDADSILTAVSDALA